MLDFLHNAKCIIGFIGIRFIFLFLTIAQIILEGENYFLMGVVRNIFSQFCLGPAKPLCGPEIPFAQFHAQVHFHNPKEEEPTEETFTVQAHERKKKRSLGELAKNLPVEAVLLKLEEDQLVCDKCGGTMKPIGKKFIRHELEIIPKQVILKAIYAVTYACDKCEKDTGFAHVVSVKSPLPLMKHSLASASTVADVMTKKYADGLPLARQEKIWAREGMELSRATLANWVIQCSQTSG